jgi:hypothetical protein
MKAKDDGTPQTALDLIRDIIVADMDMEPDRVFIFNQSWKLPPYEGLFILVEYKSGPKCVSNRNEVRMIGGAYTEVQMVNMQEHIAINFFSRNQEAELRKEEVLMAIGSLLSQGSQEENSFKIARISAIENLSELEGAAMLNRFEISLVVLTWYEKVKTADFYDSFTGRVKTEQETVDFVQNTA